MFGLCKCPSLAFVNVCVYVLVLVILGFLKQCLNSLNQELYAEFVWHYFFIMNMLFICIWQILLTHAGN